MDTIQDTATAASTASNGAKSAVVLGATGGVGAHLLRKLLHSPNYARVTAISRRPLPASAKLTNIVCPDFAQSLSEPEALRRVFSDHDVVFCCLGAPEKAMLGLFVRPKKYKELFRTVDYDYVLGFASAARGAGVPSFSVISSPGAATTARFSYLRIKGEMERDVTALGFERLSIFRPSHLMKPPNGSEKPVRRAIKSAIAWIASIMPAEQSAIRVEDVAEAMIAEYDQRLASGSRGPVTIDSDSMQTLGKLTPSPIDPPPH